MKRVRTLFGCLVSMLLAVSPAVALGCKDIVGARLDPDLAVVKSNFGRLLPERKTVQSTRHQGEKIAIERVVATRLITADGSGSADLVLTNENKTVVTGKINDRRLDYIANTAIAGLGYQRNPEEVASVLANIGRPDANVVLPKIGSTAALANLSPQATRIKLNQRTVKINGPVKTIEKSSIDYSCTDDLEFAGDPKILKTMVVLRGVLKATTVTEKIDIEPFLKLEVSDFVTLQTVSTLAFQKILADVPGIADSKAPEKQQSAVQDSQTNEVAANSPEELSEPEKVKPTTAAEIFNERVVEYFSLAKPGTWILLLGAVLLSWAIFWMLSKRRTRPEKTDERVGGVLTEPTQNSSEMLNERIEFLEKMAKTSGALQTQLQRTVDVANQEIDDSKSLKEHIDTLTVSVEKAVDENKALRSTNLERKTRLSEAESKSRDLDAKATELKTAVAKLDFKLNSAETLIGELESANDHLTSVNEDLRERIDEVEADQTALTLKLNLREGAIDEAEKLTHEVMKDNEEIRQDLTAENAARLLAETEFNRLSEDYNNLWTQTSNRVAQLRKEETAASSRERSLADELVSLGTELETVRKDRLELNREFTVLNNENNRMSSEYRTTVNRLESEIRKLNMKLTAYEQSLEEHKIKKPVMSRIQARREFARRRDERQGDDDNTLDNVVPLAQKGSDRNG